MGIEPTNGRLYRPLNGFEDRGRHQTCKHFRIRTTHIIRLSPHPVDAAQRSNRAAKKYSRWPLADVKIHVLLRHETTQGITPCVSLGCPRQVTGMYGTEVTNEGYRR